MNEDYYTQFEEESKQPINHQSSFVSGISETMQIFSTITLTYKAEDRPETYISPLYIQKMMKLKYEAIVYPLLLTFGGLPQSGKSIMLEKMLCKHEHKHQSIPSTHSLSQYELIATGLRSSKLQCIHVSQNHSLYYGMQSGFQYNFRMEGINPKFSPTQNDSTFLDDLLKSHVEAMYKFFSVKHQPSISAALPRGVALINIWELSLSRTVLTFLECFRGHLDNNHMWLFLDLDRDLKNLHLPPNVYFQTESGQRQQSQTMIWRSRLQYLLRSSGLSESLKSKRTRVCKLFAVYNGENSQLKEQLESLRSECKNAAEHIGLCHLIDFDIIPINRKNPELRKDLTNMLKRLVDELQQTAIPISWIFLCSSLQQSHSIFINHREFEKKACECGIDLASLDKFLRFFTSFGILFDIKLIDSGSQYIIVNPPKFFGKLNNIFTQSSSSSSATMVSKFGILSPQTANNIFGKEGDTFLEVLVSVGLAAKIPKERFFNHVGGFKLPQNEEDFFYISLARIDPPVKRCTPGAVQLVSSMDSPAMNMQVAFTRELLKLLPELVFVPSKPANVTKFQVCIPEKSPICLEFVVQGDIVEINMEPNGNEADIYTVCNKIVKAADHIAVKRSKRCENDSKYQFALICAQDRNPYLSYNMHHRRHVLPNETLCDMCWKGLNFNHEVHRAWNKELKKNDIQSKFKLSGDLSQNDVMMLATEISRYSKFAIEAFCKVLIDEAGSISIDDEPRWWYVSKIIMDWRRKIKEEKEFSKKALARKLLLTHEKLKPPLEEKLPEFKKLARTLDIQVLTKEQAEEAKQLIEN